VATVTLAAVVLAAAVLEHRVILILELLAVTVVTELRIYSLVPQLLMAVAVVLTD
jgi:hypothetical protein